MLTPDQLQLLGVTCQAEEKYSIGTFANLTYEQLLLTLEHWHNPGAQNANIIFANRSLIDLVEQDSQHGDYEIKHGDEKLGRAIIGADAGLLKAAVDLLSLYRP